jgi:nicotinate-nucleotide adenylyltransferase
MRLGLLGGTFDPIHCGHLDAARAAHRVLGLDRVVFVPAGVPPHRSRAPRASPFHRFAMTAIAVLGAEEFVVSDRELERAGPSYSADTLRGFRAEGWRPSQLFFITGVDAFADVETWHDYPALLADSHFVVVTRPGFAPQELESRLPALRGRFVDAHETATRTARIAGPDPAIFLIDAETTDVSSTEVRRRIAAGHSVAGLVPSSVEQHIKQHHLYTSAFRAPELHGQI